MSSFYCIYFICFGFGLTVVTISSAPIHLGSAQRGDTGYIPTSPAKQEIPKNTRTPPTEDIVVSTEEILTATVSLTQKLPILATSNLTQPLPDNTTSTSLTEILTSLEMISEQSQSTEPPLPDTNDGNQENLKPTTTPSPDTETTVETTNITNVIFTATEQERPENATTSSIVSVDVTDLVTDAFVGKTTEIYTSNAGISSSVEDILSTTPQIGLVTTATTSENITEVVSNVILTTHAIGTTEAAAVATETGPLEITTENATETKPLEITTDTQKVVTTLGMETVWITDVNMTSVVDLESTSLRDGVTILPTPEKTSASAIETKEVPPTTANATEITTEMTSVPYVTETVGITIKQASTEQIQTNTSSSTPELPKHPTSKVTQPLPGNITSTSLTEILTSPEMVTEQSQSTEPPLTDDGSEGNLKVTTPTPDRATTSLLTNISQTTGQTKQTSTLLAATTRKAIPAPRHVEASEMTEDEMQNVVNYQFKGITVSNIVFINFIFNHAESRTCLAKFKLSLELDLESLINEFLFMNFTIRCMQRSR